MERILFRKGALELEVICRELVNEGLTLKR